MIRDALDLPARPDDWQVEFLDSDRRRKILNIHRQAGKSTVSSLKCLHKAIFKPGSLSLIIAPALRQSRENFRAIQKSLELLPKKPEFHEFTKLSLETSKGSRIICLPGGNEGTTIRGFSRPDLIIEDEAARCSDELHEAIVPMMTSFPDCELILASTPWGQRGAEWLKIELKASQNPRIDKEFLVEQRNGPLGPYYYLQEFECEFIASETQLISHESILKALDNGISIVEI